MMYFIIPFFIFYVLLIFVVLYQRKIIKKIKPFLLHSFLTSYKYKFILGQNQSCGIYYNIEEDIKHNGSNSDFKKVYEVLRVLYGNDINNYINEYAKSAYHIASITNENKDDINNELNEADLNESDYDYNENIYEDNDVVAEIPEDNSLKANIKIEMNQIAEIFNSNIPKNAEETITYGDPITDFDKLDHRKMDERYKPLLRKKGNNKEKEIDISSYI